MIQSIISLTEMFQLVRLSLGGLWSLAILPSTWASHWNTAHQYLLELSVAPEMKQSFPWPNLLKHLLQLLK